MTTTRPAARARRWATRPGRTILASLSLLIGLPAASTAIAAHPKSSHSPSVTISPLPGTPDASPRTQISFLGAPADEISSVSVVGSRSGHHSGRLRSYASAPGASFLPTRQFRPGERVTVTAKVGPPRRRHRVRTSFTVAIHFPYRFPPEHSHRAATAGAGVQSFVSDPSIHPATLSVGVHSPKALPGDIFFGFNGGHAQWGPTIVDGSGRLVWFHPVPSRDHAMDFKVAEYEGKPVLVWWQGFIPPIGVGFGEDEIYNTHYQPVAKVRAGNGYHADLHEVLITPQGQAFITAVTIVKANLSSVGGYSDGGIVDPVMQEIDIKTGLVMFEWHAYGHVPLNETYSKPSPSHGWPLDFFHLNSISLDPSGDGNILISARNTWAGYEINHKTGKIMWRLGGKHSTFKMGLHTQTAYQHDIQWQPDHTITIFDNGASPEIHPHSRVLRERIDWATHSVHLINDYFHRPPLLANSQGNDQLLPNGNSFVGWGAQPYFTEFSPRGETLFDARLPTPGESYRAYRFPWKATPTTRPNAAIRAAGHGVLDFYVSWNGATEVSSWQVLGWKSGQHSSPVATSKRTGFQTKIPLHTPDVWFSAQALNAEGEVLATSRPVKR